MTNRHRPRPPIADQEHAERIARLQAQRVAAGRSPLIQSEAVYRLLTAVIDANERKPVTPDVVERER
jgi:hypothetical protein